MTIDDDAKTRELKEFLFESRKRNPILGTITEAYHEITLKSNASIQCKNYPIPQKHRDKTITELENLLKMNIIRESHSK